MQAIQTISGQDDAERMRVAASQLARMSRCVPQAYDELGELVAVRTLLRLGRPDEAVDRLEILLDRFHESWRTLA